MYIEPQRRRSSALIGGGVVSRNPTAGASIGEPRALAYTSRTPYVSYAWIYHLLTPSTLTIDRATSCRLLEYIRIVATAPVP